MKTLGEYAAALHVDFLYIKDINSYPAPQVEFGIRQRLEQQNNLTTNQKWNEEIMEDESVKELICINEVKHRQPHISRDMNEYGQQKVACYQYTAPVVNFSTPMHEDKSGQGSSSPTG